MFLKTRPRALLFACLIGTGVFFFPRAAVWAAEHDEIEEKNLCVKDLLNKIETKLDRERRRRGKTRARLGVFHGYETNANLSAHRKGDFFEGVSFAVDRPQEMSPGLILKWDYDLFAYNYHELTDNRYIMNQVGGRLTKKLGRLHLSGGANALLLNYPRNRDGDFWSPKGYLELRHYVSKTLYHEIVCDYAVKDYIHAKAMGDTSGSVQDKKRRDRQYSGAYRIGGLVGKRFSWRLGTKVTVNDANARYLDYYDYISFRHSLAWTFKMSQNDALFSSLSFTRKEYDTRTIASGDPRQFNNLYTATCGLRHRFDERTSLALYYTYRENVSNDALAEYSDSAATLSWQYHF